jgi:hypothetical protein
MSDHLNKRLTTLEEKVRHLERLDAPRQENPHSVDPQNTTAGNRETAPRKTALPNDLSDDSTNKTDKRRGNSDPWWIRISVWKPWKRFLTVAVGAAGVAYAIVTYHQWNDANRNFRVDQRPWVKVELVPSKSSEQQATVTATAGSPMTVPVRVKNIGKTPANSLIGTFAIQIAGPQDELFLPADMNNPPHVEHPKHKVGLTHIETGTIFPDQFHDWPISKVDNTSIGPSQPTTVTQEEVDRVNNGAARVYIEGTITYWDEFGRKHWTRYCTSLPGSIDNQPACPKYNRADSDY